MIRDFFNHSSIYDDCRRPRGGSVTNNSKKTLTAVPRRGPEAGPIVYIYDFHGLGANTLFMPVSREQKISDIFIVLKNYNRIVRRFADYGTGKCFYWSDSVIIAIILAVVALYIGYSTFSRITKGMDEQQELAKGNVAVGIIIAAIFFAIALVIQSGVAGISLGISQALNGDWITLIAAFIQLILGIILAVAAIYIALNILDRLTKGIDEFAELKKGNVAVALMMAGVIVSTAIIIQSGVIGITSALI